MKKVDQYHWIESHARKLKLDESCLPIQICTYALCTRSRNSIPYRRTILSNLQAICWVLSCLFHILFLNGSSLSRIPVNTLSKTLVWAIVLKMLLKLTGFIHIEKLCTSFIEITRINFMFPVGDSFWRFSSSCVNIYIKSKTHYALHELRIHLTKFNWIAVWFVLKEP